MCAHIFLTTCGRDNCGALIRLKFLRFEVPYLSLSNKSGQWLRKTILFLLSMSNLMSSMPMFETHMEATFTNNILLLPVRVQVKITIVICLDLRRGLFLWR
jgi:hypothetical protein